jgi:hypothetical protein
MEQKTIEAFQEGIRQQHGCESRYVESVPVTEEFQGQIVWSGIVHVFDLQGHPTATRCYVWAEPIGEFGPRQRVFAVLHQGPVESPLDAVRASIVHDYREQEKEAAE